MGQSLSTMNTASVPERERPGFWADCIDRLFRGLRSDLYGDEVFDGRMGTLHAGDVVLTRLEANRHRVVRSSSLVRQSMQNIFFIVVIRKLNIDRIYGRVKIFYQFFYLFFVLI